MFFNKRKPKVEQSTKLGVVCIEQDFLSSVISLDKKLLQANHGIHNIKIHCVYYDSTDYMIYAIISSPDIPEYVAFHNIMEDTVYKEIKGKKYPLICLSYKMWQSDISKDIKDDENIGQEDSDASV